MGECSKCGLCCTGFVMRVASVPIDIIYYMKLRGAKLLDLNTLWLPLRCEHLTPNGLCGIIDDTAENPRPDLCKKYPMQNDWTPDRCTAKESVVDESTTKE